MAHWSETQDTAIDIFSEAWIPAFSWPCDPERCGELLIQKKRALPEELRFRAVAYILTVMKRYPFQLWDELSRPMWHRFLDVWNDTGDPRKAMRVI